jgi:hypothetical protein
MVAVGDTAGLIQYVNEQAPNYGVDPAAALAVATQEGWSGNPGDNNTSFGPWQLHWGGAYPNWAPQSVQTAQQWAWSNPGIDYALQYMSNEKGVSGSTGQNAITNIVTNFERPRADLVAGEIAGAIGRYLGLNTGSDVGTTGSVQTSDPLLASSAQLVSGQSQAGSTGAPSLFGNEALGKIVSRVASPGFWWSVGFFILAGVLILIGLLIYFRKDVEQAAGTVARGAAEAA